MNKILHKKTKARQRRLAIDQGAYDGRLRTRVVVNKKRNHHIDLRRNKSKIRDDEKG